MFSKSGWIVPNNSDQSINASIEHSTNFFDSVKHQRIQEIRNFFRDPNLKVWTLKEENEYTALHRAAFMNSEKLVDLILEELKKRLGWEAKEEFENYWNECTTEGFTAVHYAANKGNVSIVKKLYQNGAKVELSTNRGKNVMHLAAEGNQPSIMIYFIEYHSQDIFALEDCGATPLHWACYSGAEESVLLLLSLNANINATDKEGWTPLHLAVSSNKEKIVIRLLQKGADKTIENHKHETPLQIAIIERDDFYKKLIYALGCIPEVLTLLLILPYIEGDVQTYINVIVFVLTLLTYTILYFTDAVKLQNPELEVEIGSNRRQWKALVDQGVNIISYCPTCCVQRNYLSRHCFVCNECVENFDHHCFWLNKCIGRGNWFLYLLFLFFTAIYSIHTVFLSVLLYTSEINIPDEKVFPPVFFGEDNRSYRVLGASFVFVWGILVSLPSMLWFLTQFMKKCGCYKVRKLIDDGWKNKSDEREIIKDKRDDPMIDLIEKDDNKRKLLPDDLGDGNDDDRNVNDNIEKDVNEGDSGKLLEEGNINDNADEIVI